MAEEPVEEQEQSAASPEESPTRVRIIIADSEPIFRVGMRKIFAIEDDIRVLAQTETQEQTTTAVAKHIPDVLLMESGISLDPAESISSLLQIAPKLRIVLIVTEPEEDDILEFIRRGACGVVPRSISPDLLLKCIRKVHVGEIWLDHRAINMVIEAYRAQALKLTTPKQRTRLNAKELKIIAGVTQGLRNREIATDVGTTEQVVKNYLRKIYDKLGVSDRLELALYCMHHKLLGVTQKPPEVPLPPASILESTAGK